MKNQDGIILGTLCVGMLFFFSHALSAWLPLSNPASKWTTLPVPYYVNNSGCADIGGFDPAVQVCESAFDAWEGAECTGWRVAYQGGTGASPNNNSDSQYVLGWIESGWSYGSEAIGITMVYYGGGIIGSADIAFNAQNYNWSLTGGSGYTVDAQSIATHEEGHFLGLNDIYSCLADPQTMCGYYNGGTYARTLTDDDTQGVCTLYPGSGPPPECTLDTDCDTNYRCLEQKCVGGMCAVCTSHDDCGGDYDYCLNGFADGNWYCGVNCTSEAECGAGNTCLDLGGGMKQCLPSNFDCTGTAPPACVLDTDCSPGYICQGGSCVPQPPPECTVSTECASGYICVDGHCVWDTSPHNPVCTPCGANEECGLENDDCITFYPDGTMFGNGLSYCGVSCDSLGGNCGEGFECFDFPDRPSQCLPTEHACTTCDPVYMTGCVEGYSYCDFINCNAGICRPGIRGIGVLGDKCSEDLQCYDLQCIQQLDDSFCSAACTFQPGFDRCSSLDALNSYTCQPRDFGACGYCSCASGRLGDHCGGDSDCQSGGCLTTPDGTDRSCTMFCSALINCPTFFSCQYSPDGSWGCFPTTDPLQGPVRLRPGQTCDGTVECLGGTCDPALGYCTRPCEGNCECPSDMHCEMNEGGSRICKTGSPKAGCGGCVVIEKEPSMPLLSYALAFLLMSLILVLARRKSS